MSYLLDKKIKKNKIFKIVFGVIFLIILFYFRISVFDGLSQVSQTIFRPVLVLGNSVGEKFKSLGSYFLSKKSLYQENENLKNQIAESQNDRANYSAVVLENIKLKEIFGRKNEKSSMILATILSKPNQSIYDTIIIDVGTDKGLKTGDTVFAFGNIPIGRVDFTYENSAKIVLFSSGGERTQAVVPGKDAFIELVGRGGGNFEMILPRDFTLQKGDQVVKPGLNPYLLAIVQAIISDPRDLFKKALLISPVNIQELKFVELEGK